ncbi:hypothetical protein B0H17DRAFT_1142636 [Mycena rosella]|uniref:Uncharacterized protein n=1 Tax=Mycena rosella TaxID=1033263 RepID=A0AAD7CWT2_MYCRO|nr:hypothetical protein B0H17DRAFT_1142636 [Mycena rosella]
MAGNVSFPGHRPWRAGSRKASGSSADLHSARFAVNSMEQRNIDNQGGYSRGLRAPIIDSSEWKPARARSWTRRGIEIDLYYYYLTELPRWKYSARSDPEPSPGVVINPNPADIIISPLCSAVLRLRLIASEVDEQKDVHDPPKEYRIRQCFLPFPRSPNTISRISGLKVNASGRAIITRIVLKGDVPDKKVVKHLPRKGQSHLTAQKQPKQGNEGVKTERSQADAGALYLEAVDEMQIS